MGVVQRVTKGAREMNQRPSQRVNAYIDTIRDEAVPHSVLILDLEQMRDQFQKDEAEAYRSIQSLIKYVGMKEAI